MTNFDNNFSYIEINPPAEATHTIMWLHGLGADGNDFVPLIEQLNLPKNHNVRFIFPHALVRPVTLNNNYPMRAWYDIYALTRDAKIDKTGIQHSTQLIETLIQREIEKGISGANIFLGGFSQGAAMALTIGLGFAKPLAGIMALSGYLPLADEVTANAPAANKQIPIFLAHGTEDTVVPFAAGELTYKHLQKANYHVDWHTYPIAHSVSHPEINDIRAWIMKRLGL